MSSMTIQQTPHDHLFLNLQITRLDIRPHIKWIISLVIDMVTLIFRMDLYGLINILTLSHLRVRQG